MISHELKLLAIDHNEKRASDQQFAHQAYLVISDELAKEEKLKATKQNEQNHQVSQNEAECSDSIILDEQTRILNEALERKKIAEEKSKKVIEECKEQIRYYQEQARYYREKTRQLKEQNRQIREKRNIKKKN